MRQEWFHLTLTSCVGLALLILGLQSAKAQEICVTQSSGDQIREATRNGYAHEPMVTFREDSSNINTWYEYPRFPPVAIFDIHGGGSFLEITVTSSNPGVA